MGTVDIIVLCVVGVAVVGIAAYLVYRKVKHKGGCDCGCGSCSGCPHCKNR